MDQKFLKELEKSCMIDVASLAAKFGMSEEEAAKEITSLQKNGILCGCHALINWDEASEDLVTALIEVKVTPHERAGYHRIAERIANIDAVKSLYLMSGGYDFTVIIEERTMREVSAIVMDKIAVIDSVQSTATHIILKKYKEGGISLSSHCDDRRMSITL